MVIMVIGPDTVYCGLCGLCHCRYRPSSTHNAGLQGGIFTHILYIFYFEFLWKTSFLSRNEAQKLLKEGTKILDFPSLNCGQVRIYLPLLCGGWVVAVVCSGHRSKGGVNHTTAPATTTTAGSSASTGGVCLVFSSLVVK